MSKHSYHFLTGQAAVTKTFEAETPAAADALAIEFAKSKKGVIRVQSDRTLKHIYEAIPKAQQPVEPEALLDQKADPDADPPVPGSAAIATTIGLAAKAAALIMMTAMLLFGMTSKAATVVGVGGSAGVPSYAVNSQIGSQIGTSIATNGLYTGSIVSPVAATAVSVVETNLIQVNPGVQPDGDVILQLGAQATAATGATNTITWTFTGSVLPVTITNSTTLGNNGSANPRGTLASYTLALNGTTPVTTNIVLSKFSTPAIANGLAIYCESIGVVAGATATNYYVAVVQ